MKLPDIREIIIPEMLPQKFFVSRESFEEDGYIVRPLTVAGLIKGILGNLLWRNCWRLVHAVKRMGFLSTPEGGRPDWSDLTWRFLSVLDQRGKAKGIAREIGRSRWMPSRWNDSYLEGGASITLGEYL